MSERCFICRQPVDGVYRREIAVARTNGWAYGTALRRTASVTYAPVSLCARCDAEAAARLQRSLRPGGLGFVLGLVMLLIGIGFISSVVEWLADSKTAGNTTVVVLWSGVGCWAIRRALSHWLKKTEVRDETPGLHLRDGTPPRRTDRARRATAIREPARRPGSTAGF